MTAAAVEPRGSAWSAMLHHHHQVQIASSSQVTSTDHYYYVHYHTTSPASAASSSPPPPDHATSVRVHVYALVLVAVLLAALLTRLSRNALTRATRALGTRPQILEQCLSHRHDATPAEDDLATRDEESAPSFDLRRIASRPLHPSPPPLPCKCYHDHVAPPRPLTRLITRLRGVLVSQAAPIHIIPVAIPSTGCVVVLGLVVLWNLVLWCVPSHHPTSIVDSLSCRGALLAAANLPFYVVFAARSRPLHVLLDLSSDTRGACRATFGAIIVVQAGVHILHIIWTYRTMLSCDLAAIIVSMSLLSACVAICLARDKARCSSSARNRCACVFGLQLGILVAWLWYQREGRLYTGPALALCFLDGYLAARSHPAVDHANIHLLEDGKSLQLSLHFLEPLRITPTTRDGMTEVVRLTIPALGYGESSRSFPVSITAAMRAACTTDDQLRFSCSLEDSLYVTRLRSALKTRTVRVCLDRPHVLRRPSRLADTNLTFVVAGGSSISAAWPLVEDVLNYQTNHPVQMVRARQQAVVLIWIIRSSAHLNWIGRQALADLENRGAIIHVPRATDEIGRPDLLEIAGEYIPGFAGAPDDRTSMVGVGSPSLCRAVRNAASRLIQDGRQVDVMVGGV